MSGRHTPPPDTPPRVRDPYVWVAPDLYVSLGGERVELICFKSECFAFPIARDAPRGDSSSPDPSGWEMGWEEIGGALKGPRESDSSDPWATQKFRGVVREALSLM